MLRTSSTFGELRGASGSCARAVPATARSGSRASRIRRVTSARTPLRARTCHPLLLVDLLLGLVVGERFERVDVAQRRVPRDELLRGLHAEALGEDAAEGLDLHL